MKTWLGLLAATAVLYGVNYAAAAESELRHPANPSAGGPDACVTAAEHNQIRKGMRMARVHQIIDGTGGAQPFYRHVRSYTWCSPVGRVEFIRHTSTKPYRVMGFFWADAK